MRATFTALPLEAPVTPLSYSTAVRVDMTLHGTRFVRHCAGSGLCACAGAAKGIVPSSAATAAPTRMGECGMVVSPVFGQHCVTVARRAPSITEKGHRDRSRRVRAADAGNEVRIQ